MTDIIIENLHRSDGGSVRAEFDAVLGGVTIRGARLVEGRNGRFLGLPSRKDRDTDKWYEVIVLSDALRSRVQVAAEEALRVAPPQADVPDGVPF